VASTIPRRLNLLGFVDGPDFGRVILSHRVLRHLTFKVCEKVKISRGRTLRVILGKKCTAFAVYTRAVRFERIRRHEPSVRRLQRGPIEWARFAIPAGRRFEILNGNK
jgi:hypothetical protein